MFEPPTKWPPKMRPPEGFTSSFRLLRAAWSSPQVFGSSHDAVVDERARLADGHEAELAHGDHQLRHEGVVQLHDLDVGGLDTGHRVGTLGRDAVGDDAVRARL